MKKIKPEPLTRAAFAPFGEVIESADNPSYPINYGMADRYHALARVQVDTPQGVPVVSLVNSKKYPLPQKVRVVERHPLGSQAFIPRGNTPFIVVVAEPGEPPAASQLHAFITNGEQGINYHAGVWHGLLLTPFDAMSFICVDRDGVGDNCEEHHYAEQDQYLLDI